MHVRTKALSGAALALIFVGGACGSTDDETASPTTVSSAPATTGAAAAKEVAVTGVDYAYEGVPKKVAPGTVVKFTNTSTKEVHEIVALKVKDGENRPMSTLLKLPEAEQEGVAEFQGVAIALPGKPTLTPRGPVTLAQPGRYLLVCNIKTDADPAAYEAAMQKPGPPADVPGGPPHWEKGMATEVTVA